MFALIQLIREKKSILSLGMHEGESAAVLILEPFDFVCVCTICKSVLPAAVCERFLVCTVDPCQRSQDKAAPARSCAVERD